MEHNNQAKNRKSLFLLLVSLSLSSFLFVNVYAFRGNDHLQAPKEVFTVEALEDPESKDQRINLPDVAVLEKIFNLAQRLIPGR